MARSKRTAEDIARLIHLERDPLPPSELAKISAWLNTETRKTTRPFMAFVVGPLFASCAFLLCAALVLSPSQLHEISEFMTPFMISEFTTLFMALAMTAVAVLALGREVTRIGRIRRAFLQGFVCGIRVSEPGAPKKWTTRVCKETVDAVQAVAAERGMSVARSIEILKKRDPERWRSLSEPRYYEAVRRLEKSAT
jgi:hypothetical protein